jgi:type IV pilus assembly protein PilM
LGTSPDRPSTIATKRNPSVANSLVALHLSNRALHGLVVRPAKGGWTVLAGASVALSGDEQQDLAPSFRALARQLRLPSRQPVALCLARQQAIIRCVQLPATDPAELAQMARFEAERHIPFNAERHCVGFHVMRSKGVEGSEVLLGAMDGPIVDSALAAIQGGGLRPGGISISSTCLVNVLLSQQAPDRFAERVQAIVGIGLDSMDLVFVQQGRVCYARSVAMDLRGALEAVARGPHAAEAAAPPSDPAKLAMAACLIDCQRLDQAPGAEALTRWIDRVGQEIQRTYDFARREMKCPPIQAIALTGEGAFLRGLDRLLAEGGDIEVTTLNPVTSLPGADALKLPFHGLELAMAYGALVGVEREGAYRVDLTPHSHYRAEARRGLTRQAIVAGVLLAASAGLATGAWMRHQDLNARALAAYQEINEKMKPEVAALQQMTAKRKIIETFISDPNAAMTVFDSIVKAPVIGINACLERVAFSKGDSITLAGKAKTIQDISDFVTYLNDTGHFQSVTRSNQIPTVLEGRPVFSFSLECKLSTSADKDDKAAGDSKNKADNP